MRRRLTGQPFLLIVLVCQSTRATGSITEESPYSFDNIRNCGPRCLAFLEQYAGKSTSYERVVDLCPPTRDGVTMLELTSAAKTLGWRVESFRASFGQLCRLRKLAILHLKATETVDKADNWTDNHFVVLLGFNASTGKYLVYDPPREIREMDASYLKKRFLGLGLLLCRTEEEAKANSLTAPWRLWLFAPVGALLAMALCSVVRYSLARLSAGTRPRPFPGVLAASRCAR